MRGEGTHLYEMRYCHDAVVSLLCPVFSFLFVFLSISRFVRVFPSCQICCFQFSRMEIFGTLRSYAIAFLSQKKRLQFQPVKISP